MDTTIVMFSCPGMLQIKTPPPTSCNLPTSAFVYKRSFHQSANSGIDSCITSCMTLAQCHCSMPGAAQGVMLTAALQ